MREFNGTGLLLFALVMLLGMLLGGAGAQLVTELLMGADELSPLWIGVFLAALYLVAWLCGVGCRREDRR